MRVGAAEAERAHAGDAPPGRRGRPRRCADPPPRSSWTVQVDVRARLAESAGCAGSVCCCSASTTLISPATPRRAFEMADVGLDRADQQRLRCASRSAPKHRAERLQLDRIAERRARAVRLDVADSRGATPARASAVANDRLCAGPLGAVSPLLGPSWLTALPRITRIDAVAVAPRRRRAASARRRRSPRRARSRRPSRRTSCSGRRAQHAPHLRQRDGHLRRQDQVDAAGQRQRRTRRCAGSGTPGAPRRSDDEHAVSIERRPLQARASTRCVPAATLCAVPEARVRVELSPTPRRLADTRVVVGAHADEHAGATACNLARRQAGVLRAPPTRPRAAAAAAGPWPAPRAARCRRTRGRTGRRPRGSRRRGVASCPACPGRGRRARRVPALGRHLADRVDFAVEQAPQRSGESTPPGKRQPMPTTAIGSRSAIRAASSSSRSDWIFSSARLTGLRF